MKTMKALALSALAVLTAAPAFAGNWYDVTLDMAPITGIGTVIITAIGAVWVARKAYVFLKKS